jgi:hypothetical protein
MTQGIADPVIFQIEWREEVSWQCHLPKARFKVEREQEVVEDQPTQTGELERDRQTCKVQ